MQPVFDWRPRFFGERRSSGGENSVYGARMNIRIALIVFLMLAGARAAFAADYIAIPYGAMASVCPAGESDEPPNFDEPECTKTPLQDIDPQGRHIWLRLVFDVDASKLPETAPVGLFVSAKTSSAAWLNGAYLGANGAPGADPPSERPGRMDAVFYVPHDAVRDGENELVMRMSAQHGFLHLNYPIHWLVLGRYADPSRAILGAYWPSMITFGAFLLSAIYFGVSTFRRAASNSGLLLLLSLLAIAQLALETARGLIPYAYPFHDLRLVLITACAAAFGLCLFFHTVRRFLERRRTPVLLAGAAATALAVILPSGFDAKAVFGLMAPTALSAAIAIQAALGKQPSARAYAIALALFIGLALLLFFVSSAYFLDFGFFYCVAGLLLFLIGQQAALFAKERALHLDAADRARRLELALAQARQKDAPERLTLQSAGKTEIVNAAAIVYVKGAGDYAEITLGDGKRKLYLAKLHELESALPQTFLRVHRSYLVNTDYVQSLTRQSSGVGALLLKTGDEVPVSRRILPQVRSALS